VEEGRGYVKRHGIKPWVGACLLASTAAAGCNHAQRTPILQAPHVAAPLVRAPVARAPEVVSPPARLPPVTTSTSASIGRTAFKEPSARVEEPRPPSEPLVKRKPVVDPAGSSCFARADDYSWLSGELQFSRLKGWRLRYASVAEADPYGGSVTLIDNELLRGLKDGQLVMVEGRLVNPDARNIAPEYRVRSIQPIDAKK
jgi:hypothetical protein